MSKLDELMKSSRAVAAESMGAPRPSPVHGAAPAPATAPAGQVPERLRGIVRSKNAAEIPVDRIGPDPDQPREEFDDEALDRLAESLRAKGQLQPIRVRWEEGRGHYVIICGERRWRAAQRAGIEAMSCVIVEGPLGPGELLALQLIENCVREDLRPIEQARAFRALIDRNGWSARQVARELGVDPSGVVRALALLELPSEVRDQVERGALPPATAYEVSKLEDPEAQAEVAARVVAGGLSRAEAVRAVRKAAGAPGPKGAKGQGAKARKATARVIRTSTGSRVTVETVENRRGLDDDAVLAALLDAVAQLRGESGHGGDQAAA
jgi:ParB family chromosome partitioning protein